MSHNTYGHLFRVTTWGESHGPAIGGVVDGVPPRIELSEADIQPWLDKRRPGQSRFTTQRQESDTVEIQSGVFDTYVCVFCHAPKYNLVFFILSDCFCPRPPHGQSTKRVIPTGFGFGYSQFWDSTNSQLMGGGIPPP